MLGLNLRSVCDEGNKVVTVMETVNYVPHTQFSTSKRGMKQESFHSRNDLLRMVSDVWRDLSIVPDVISIRARWLVPSLLHSCTLKVEQNSPWKRASLPFSAIGTSFSYYIRLLGYSKRHFRIYNGTSVESNCQCFILLVYLQYLIIILPLVIVTVYFSHRI